MERDRLLFAVNGERFELVGEDPSTTVLEFLRTRTRYKGAKLGCGEGGCGACVVLLSKYDPISKQVEQISVSSCLTLLYSVHLCAITTTEGLGNTKNGFHSIHKRISGFHGSQCGFCTPGMCVSLFSALSNADKTGRPEPPAGFSKLTVSEAEKAIAGHLCRCTGYRSIVDTCKSFASDVDMEDLGLNSFWKKGENDAAIDKLPLFSSHCANTFPHFLKTEVESLLRVKTVQLNATGGNGYSSIKGVHWLYPRTIDEVLLLLKSRDGEGCNKIKLVTGNTGSGVYKDREQYDLYIDLKGIPELLDIRRDATGIEIGASVTISKAIEVLKEENLGCSLPNETLVFSRIAYHMNKVASPFIRNTASIGGNLIMAQRDRFPSDIATILLAVGSSVSIQSTSERFILTLEEFLEKPPFSYGFLLLSIHIPNWNNVHSLSCGSLSSTTDKQKGQAKVLYETYRASPRPLGGALAYTNAAFIACISAQVKTGDVILEKLQLAFGAYGSEHAIRARKVEEFLVGKSITRSVMQEAIRLLKAIILPNKGTPHPAYRVSLAVSFLFDLLCSLTEELNGSKGVLQADNLDVDNRIELHNGFTGLPAGNNSYIKSIDNDLSTMIFPGKQIIKLSRDYIPVGEPIKKVNSEIQASGEAVYVNDIPTPKDCLYGAFVYSTKPMSRIKAIELKSTAAQKNKITFISLDDIPNGGKNIGSASIFGEDPLFADSITQYAGEPLGVVIAETQKLANTAAGEALVHYDSENLELPVLTIAEAVKKTSFLEVPSFLKPEPVGNFLEGMESADMKIISAEVNLGSQYHFYMEPQNALAIPDEDNCLVVYTSSQAPMIAQDTIAKCLGIPCHNVRAITRRVGGGFGGKAFRSLPVATACALAAYKLQRPVSIYLDRKTDMVMTGGRHPMKINFSVGFKSDGKITALHVDILIDAGISQDASPAIPFNLVKALKKYDWGALSLNVKLCKTNVITKTAMRSPGEVQGSYIAEAIIEHVATTLSVDSDSVRKRNMHNFESLQLFYKGIAGEPNEFTLPYIFEKLDSFANYQHRLEGIQIFNGHNLWKKRGISRIPLINPVTLRPTPGKVGILNDASVVVEVGGIELGQGLWTKVKQMAAFALGRLCSDGEEILDKIRVIQADSLSLAQGGYTAGSTTSESSCEAVRLACNILVDRLMPIKEGLHEKMGASSWDALIRQANFGAVNLSASAYFSPDHNSLSYLIYGAAVSEVEIDQLTGATKVLQTDLIYDCGQSLNPAVDLGQIEGSFVQGIGFFMLEEVLSNADGLVISDSTWTYKIPTVDTIPRQFNVELLNSGHHQNRILSSKASGEPPLLLAASVHCATREAIRAARKDLFSHGGFEGSPLTFELPVPATMPVVKELCGFDNVERYLESELCMLK